MIAVIFMPSADDAGSGPIVQTIEGGAGTIAATAEAVGGVAIEVAERRDDYDTAFRVVAGEVVAR